MSYAPNKTYTLLEDMNVRTEANAKAKLVPKSDWTKDALKHRNSDGTLKKDTKVTAKQVKTSGKSVWIKTPTGWICAVGSTGHSFIR